MTQTKRIKALYKRYWQLNREYAAIVKLHSYFEDLEDAWDYGLIDREHLILCMGLSRGRIHTIEHLNLVRDTLYELTGLWVDAHYVDGLALDRLPTQKGLIKWLASIRVSGKKITPEQYGWYVRLFQEIPF